MFVLYAMLAGLAALVYRALPRTLGSGAQQRVAPLTTSKKTVYTLAALFSLDAFAGGFVVQSMVALWLYQKFWLSLAAAGTLFFWTGILTAGSYLVAARIASRFGLINTMVFTHLPSSLCLIAIPFMPSLGYVIVLLFVRSALSQMDVPTRSSYVMAIVPPAERPAAASITSVPRSLASAISPMLAGYLLTASTFGWPLLDRRGDEDCLRRASPDAISGRSPARGGGARHAKRRGPVTYLNDSRSLTRRDRPASASLSHAVSTSNVIVRFRFNRAPGAGQTGNVDDQAACGRDLCKNSARNEVPATTTS